MSTDGVDSATLSSMENAKQHSGAAVAAASSSGGTFGNIINSSIDNELGHVTGNIDPANFGSIDSVTSLKGAISGNPLTEFFDHGNMSQGILYTGAGEELGAKNIGFGNIDPNNLSPAKQTNTNMPKIFSSAQQQE